MIVHLQKKNINQLLDAFKDESKVIKSYILAINALAGVIVPT